MAATRREFLAAAAVAPEIVRSPRDTRSRAARTPPEEGNVLTREDVPTPALLLDLDAFEANVTRMAAHLKARGKGFRPHGKTHKCPRIAQALVKAGAVGSCVAKLSEAEIFAEHGIPNLLVTTQVLGRRKVARAVALAARHRDTIFVVDDALVVQDFNDAAAAAGARPPLRVNLAVDLLFGRTGIAPGAPALELAQRIASLPHLRLAGLQAYDGGAAHTVGFEERRKRSEGSLAQAIETRRLIEGAGLDCPIVSCGSTGTYNIDSEIAGVTELQPGSFMFMDTDYNRIGGQDGPVFRDFRNALTVVTTVVSRRPNVGIVDGGFKAFSTDRSFTPEPKALPGVTYAWAGDEHGRLDLTNAPTDVKLGDRIEFIVPHCDPSVNLYDRIYALRGDRVEAVWPVSARGMSQ